MALLSLSLPLALTTPRTASFISPSPPSTSSPSSSNKLPLLVSFIRTRSLNCTAGWRRPWTVRMAPEEEKMTRRSPLDFPIEWERPKPGRRPDIFPQFSPMKTPLPPPMPYDPPEEDEDDEEEKKEEEEEEDPEKQGDPDDPQQ